MPKRQVGVTFIELIISIVVIGIAVSGVLLVMNTTVSRSADPMLQQQAGAIAEAYLEEILLKPFAGAGGGSRSTYDNIWDYNGLADSPPRDQFGNALTQLGAYTVSVTVQGSTALPAVSPGALAVIHVNVTHPSGIDLTLSGYRADY